MSRRRDKKPSEPRKPSSSEPQTPPIAPTPQVTPQVTPVSSPVDIGALKSALFPALPSLSRIMSVVMLVIGIFAVGILFYQVMAGFFIPLFLAALLVVIFRPVHDWIYVRLGGRGRLAAVTTTTLILVIVLLPVILVISVAATQFTSLIRHVGSNNVGEAIDRVRDRFGLSLPYPDKFQRLNHLADTFDDGTSKAMIAKQTHEVIGLVEFLESNVDGPESAQQEAERAVRDLQQFLVNLDHDDEAVSDPDSDSDEESGTGTDNDAHTDTSTDTDKETDTDTGTDTSTSTDSSTGTSETQQGTRSTSDEAESETSAAADLALVTRESQTENERTDLDRSALIASASIRSWMHTLLGGTFRSQFRLIPTPSAASLANLLKENREALQPRFVQLTSATGGLAIEFLIGLGILVVSVYFFLIDGPAMIRTLMRLSPLDDDYERRLLLEFDRTSRAVVLASVLSALAQGILATIAYYFAGLDSLVLLFLATSLMALVPFLGAASVWIPCALWLGAVQQHYTEATALAIFGVLVISSIDNVIKVFVLHGRSQLHPLFALLSVLGGVRVFGPIGILVGPMVVVFLQTLLEILNHELGQQPPDELADLSADELSVG